MSCPKQAVLIFEEDAAVPAGLKPLMLETVLSRPILSWVCDRLRAEGVQRLFAVCGPRFAEEARGILPPESAVSEQWTDLESFLVTDGATGVLPAAPVPLVEAGNWFPAGCRSTGRTPWPRLRRCCGRGKPPRKWDKEKSEFVRPMARLDKKINDRRPGHGKRAFRI